MALVTKNFSDIITFTRASTGTFFNSSGVLTSAAINTPRFDYNPVTLAPRGLLIEEARTNLALYSAKLDQFSSPAVWNLNGAGATLTATTDIAAPDGTMTAWTLTSSGATAQIQQTPAVVISTVYTGSFWIRRRSGTGTINIRVVENVNTPLTGVTSQWQRFNFTATSTSTTGRIGVFLSGLSDAVDIWGAQLEAGSFPTSYIPTTAIQVTRSADEASVNTLSPWFNATEGTFVAQSLITGGSTNFVSRFIGAATNIYMANGYVGGAGNTTASSYLRNGAAAAQISSAIGTKVAGTVYKEAIRYSSTSFREAANGTLGNDITPSAGIPTVSKLDFAASAGSTASTAVGQLWLRRFTYYPRSFSDAELTSISA